MLTAHANILIALETLESPTGEGRGLPNVPCHSALAMSVSRHPRVRPATQSVEGYQRHQRSRHIGWQSSSSSSGKRR